jgi:hypothetical protein
MTIKSILSAAIVSGLSLYASSGAALATEAKSFKPIQGMTFSAGDTHAVGYFTNDKGGCQLVLTLAGEPDWQNGSLAVTRVETSVPAGQLHRYDHAGHGFQFGCAASAEAMTFQALTTVAADVK